MTMTKKKLIIFGSIAVVVVIGHDSLHNNMLLDYKKTINVTNMTSFFYVKTLPLKIHVSFSLESLSFVFQPWPIF